MKRHFLGATALAGALALAACAQTTESEVDATATQSPAATDTAMATDAAMTPGAEGTQAAGAFVTEAMMIDNAEIAAGGMAADKGASQGVKDYGRTLVSEHTAHKAKVATLAGTMNMATTDDTKPEDKALAAKLEGLSGAQFDTAFLDGMIDGHKKAIAKYETQAAASGPAPVVALAKETLPTLRTHLEKAESLRKAM